jgi:NAD(P)-dependent dehydrogenase (short-subunit alcohol dehydrogenase family)
MADRAAIVTRASSGIGLAIARMLGGEGYAVTAAARRPDKLSGAVEELRQTGTEVEEVAGNMADEDDVKRIVAAHKERFGRLDMLVNNAGVAGRRHRRRRRDKAGRPPARGQPAGDHPLLPRVRGDAARRRKRAPQRGRRQPLRRSSFANRSPPRT